MSTISDVPTGPLSSQDRRIVGALQIHGRASWRRIAEVLQIPERTVARRGSQLLADGQVVVTGLSFARIGGSSPWVVRFECEPGMARIVADTLARRRDCTYSYVTVGGHDVVTEIMCTPERFAVSVMDELSSIHGVRRTRSVPILHAHRSVHDWSPYLLDEAERIELAQDVPPLPVNPAPSKISASDRVLLGALSENGRRSNEDLARLAGVSEGTVRRRIETLSSEGMVFFRAVVEPALLQLPLEALIWIRTRPAKVVEIGNALAADPAVRYAAELDADFSFLVDIPFQNRTALRQAVTSSRWALESEFLEVTYVVDAFKRSGVLARRFRLDESVFE